MALPATDNFNRADATPAGGNWTSVPGTAVWASDMKILSNALTSADVLGDGAAYWNADAFANDQYSQAKLTNAGTADLYFYILGRCSPSAETTYYLRILTGTSVGLRKCVAGTVTPIGTDVAYTGINNDIAKLKVVGNVLTGYINGAQVITATDSSSPIASGSAGIGCFDTVPIIDDWEGGNVSSSAAVTGPFPVFRPDLP